MPPSFCQGGEGSQAPSFPMSFLGRGLTRPWAQSQPCRRLLALNPPINNHTRRTSATLFPPTAPTTATMATSTSTSSSTPSTTTSTTTKPQPPSIQSITPLASSAAKWVELNQIAYTDQTGRARLWEVASRKTRGASGIDAVAIGAILLYPPHAARPPATILVLQYRPPVDATTVEWPAGLVDAAETAEEAAVRELREETGFVGRVVDVSPIVASDPGMTTANMRLVMVVVELEEGNSGGEGALPLQQLDEGEHIQRLVVPLDELYDTLVAYSKQEGMVVSAKLWHWAAGMHFAAQLGKIVYK